MVKARLLVVFFASLLIAPAVSAQVTEAVGSSSVDPALAAFIAKIRAVDNHTHVNTTAPDDSEYDALPLEPLAPFPLPVRLQPENPDWSAAARALYGYRHADLNEPHVIELRRARESVAREQGDKFPEWVLDRIGTEVMLANRVAMGPGLAPPRRPTADGATLLPSLPTLEEG